MEQDSPAVQGPLDGGVRALPEPLPCPFCGKQPELDNPDTLYPSGTGWKLHRGFRAYVGFREVPKEQWCYGMHCCECCGGCGAEIHGDSAAEAVEKWNRRPNGSRNRPSDSEGPG